jgi:hypothetical protein
VRNVELGGCPALFDPETLDRGFAPPAQIERIVVTAPAGRRFYPQFFELCRAVRGRFPLAQIVASFHRGLDADRHTRRRSALALRAVAAAARRLWRVEPVDTAYDTGRIAFYRDMDLHVGYRVHAHVFFQAAHKPSFLLQEDTRGLGMSRALELDGSDVWASGADAVGRVLRAVEREMDRGFAGFEGIPELIRQYHRVTERVLRASFAD